MPDSAFAPMLATSLATVILDERGSLLFANSVARACIAADRDWLPRVGEVVRARTSLPPQPAPTLGTGRHSVFKLDGEADSVVYLAQVPAPGMAGLHRTPAQEALFAKLSVRQREVLEYAVAGATLSEIAQRLGVNRETSKTHLRAVYRRLFVATRAELIELWTRSGTCEVETQLAERD